MDRTSRLGLSQIIGLEKNRVCPAEVASPLERNQQQFRLVELNIVTGKPRDLVRPGVGCCGDVGNLMPFG
jgi:hypothetical protein